MFRAFTQQHYTKRGPIISPHAGSRIICVRKHCRVEIRLGYSGLPTSHRRGRVVRFYSTRSSLRHEKTDSCENAFGPSLCTTSYIIIINYNIIDMTEHCNSGALTTTPNWTRSPRETDESSSSSPPVRVVCNESDRSRDIREHTLLDFAAAAGKNNNNNWRYPRQILSLRYVIYCTCKISELFAWRTTPMRDGTVGEGRWWVARGGVKDCTSTPCPLLCTAGVWIIIL